MLVLTEDKETGTFQVGTTGKRICASIQGWVGNGRMGFTAVPGMRRREEEALRRRYLFIGRPPTGKRQGATRARVGGCRTRARLSISLWRPSVMSIQA